MLSISVIVPNYNHAKFLAQRLDSILAQTCQNFEVIILDDCSADNSRDIIEQYRNHPKVSQIVFNEQNGGSTFKQWEKGIALAKGEWIWIAESDDWCEPAFLDTMMRALDGRDECVIGYCQSYCIVNENEIRFQSQHSKLTDYCNGRDFIKDYLLTGNAIYNASMAVWRKDKFASVSKAFTNYKFCGDWLFWAELAGEGNVMISGRLLNYFRKHDRDVSGGAYESGLSIVEEIKMVRYLFEKGFIDGEEYNGCIERRYYQFQERETRLERDRAEEIRSLLLSERHIKNLIKRQGSRLALKKYFKKIIY